MRELPYRQIHLDFHTSPLIQGVGEKFNADEFVSILKKANVNSINLFAKCHHGMYYYPTKIGRMHPGLKFDLLGAQMEACAREGIRTCIYTTVAWNEDWADRHPEWLQVNMDGILGNKKPFDTDYHSWRYLCLNNEAHKEYLKREFDETYERYKPAGYWIDIIQQRGCICPTCITRMKKMGLDPQKVEDVTKHDRFTEIGFMKEFYEYLKNKDGNLGIYFNGHPCELDLADNIAYSTRQKRLYNTYLDIESLPSDLWGYTHFPVIVNYLNKYSKEITMMNGKFHKAWGDFGTIRNLEALEYECFRAIANGAKCCIGDQLHPSGKIDSSVYQRIGEVYKSIAEKEKWCIGTRKFAQIGVFVSNKVLDDDHTSNEGAYRMLSELHYLFDFIDYEDKLEGYGLIILPDRVHLSDKVASKLKDYIDKGGKLILTGSSGLNMDGSSFALDSFGVEYIAKSAFTPRYIHIDSNNFPDILPMDYVMYEQGIEAKALAGAKVLAYITKPYFNRTYDAFCSHRQTPPEAITAEPAIIQNKNVIFISNPLFRDYANNGNKVFRDIIKSCIERLLPNTMVITDLPSTAELTVRVNKNQYIVHLLHYIPQRKCRAIDIIDEKISLYNQTIKIALKRKVERVYLAPQEVDLDYHLEEGYVTFKIPEIYGHQMVVVDFK